MNSYEDLKPEAFVYVPERSTKLHLVFEHSDRLYVDITGHGYFYFDEQGKVKDSLVRKVWPATQESKQELEKFYNIQLEEIPSPSLQEFIRTLAIYRENVERHCNEYTYDVTEQDLEYLEQSLINLFKDRDN